MTARAVTCMLCGRTEWDHHDFEPRAKGCVCSPTCDTCTDDHHQALHRLAERVERLERVVSLLQIQLATDGRIPVASPAAERRDGMARVDRFSLDEIRTAYQYALPNPAQWMLLRQALWELADARAAVVPPVAEQPAAVASTRDDGDVGRRAIELLSEVRSYTANDVCWDWADDDMPDNCTDTPVCWGHRAYAVLRDAPPAAPVAPAAHPDVCMTYPEADCRVRPGRRCHHEACQVKAAPPSGVAAAAKQDPGGGVPTLGKLDPGIRATVAQLRAWGFVTTDSGDGVSKFRNGTADAYTFPQAHVACAVPRRRMVEESHRALRLLRKSGLPQAVVELTYNPADETATMFVYEVTDYVWPPDKRPPGFDQLLAAPPNATTPASGEPAMCTCTSARSKRCAFCEGQAGHSGETGGGK